MAKTYIGLSGLNSIDNPAPGIGVAKALKEDHGLDLSIVGLAYDAMESGVYLDQWFDHAFLMPYPSAGKQAFLERIFYIKETCGLDYLLPTLDVELPLYIACADELAKGGVGVLLPSKKQFEQRGKEHLAPLAESLGLKLPKTKKVTSEEELAEAAKELKFPLMIKGVYYRAIYASNMAEALSAYYVLVAEWGYPVLVQEYKTGQEINLVGVGDGKGNSLGMVAIKKMGTTTQGKIWTGVSIRHPQLLEAGEKFVNYTKWLGPFELECLVDGDKLYLIEINPRFPAWSYFGAALGVNLAANLIRAQMGLPLLEQRQFEAGQLYIRYVEERIMGMETLSAISTKGER